MNNGRIKATLIPRPSWSRQFTVRIRNDEARACCQQTQARCNEIGPNLHERDEQFLNDSGCAFLHEEEGPPLGEGLRGE